MKIRAAFLVVALSVCAILLVFVLDLVETDSRAPADVHTVPAAGPTPELARDAVTARAHASASSGSAHRIEAGRAIVWDSPGDVRLRIVDESEEPLPHARVHVLEPRADAGPGQGRWFAGEPELETLFAHAGSALAADSQGELVIPRPARPTFVSARAGARFGVQRIDRDAAALILVRIVAEDPLCVRVVDGAGQPVAGVALGVYAEGDLERPLAAGVTGKSGEFRAQCLAARLNERDGDRDGDVERVLVRADPALLPDLEVALPLVATKRDPVTLTLPSTGSIQIAIVDANDAVLPVEGTVRIEIEPASVHLARVPDEIAPARILAVRAGRASVSPVALGLDFRAALEAPFRSDDSIVVAGPRRAGDVAAARIRVTDEALVVRGRLRLEDGSAASARRFTLSTWDIPADPGWAGTVGGKRTAYDAIELCTSADGSFATLLPRKSRFARVSRVIVRRAVLALRSADGRVAAAQCEIGSVDGAGELDLGALTLRAPPVLVAGIVRDDLGNGVGRATVEVVWLDPDCASRTLQGIAPATTDPIGRFAIVGPDLPLPIGLVVNSETCRTVDPCGVLLAADMDRRDVEVRVARLGILRGSMLVDEDPGPVFVRFQPAGAEASHDATRMLAAWPVVGFEFTGLPPCAGRLAISREPGGTPVVTIDDVRIAAGLVTEDPRLVDIDLRGRLGHRAPASASEAPEGIELTVVDEHGAPIPRGVVRFARRHDAWRHNETFLGGRARVPADVEGNITLWASDRRAASVDPRAEPKRVVLEAALVAQIAVKRPSELADPRLTLEIRASALEFGPGGEPGILDALESIPCDATGRARFASPFPARFVLALRVRRIDPATRAVVRESETVDLLPMEILVEDRAGVQAFEVEIAPAALARIVRDLGL